MKKNIRILIVEDEMIASTFLSLFLEKEGYEIIGVCEEGETAITLAKEEKPDLIFMDIYLKDELSGCDAALRIVSLIKTKIIFLTAYSDDEMLQYSTQIGAVNYLLKPYNEAQILVALKIAFKDNAISTIEKPKEILELIDGYHYHFKDECLYKNTDRVKLSNKANKLLLYLCKYHTKIISEEELCECIYTQTKSTSTLRALISRIKKSLQSDIVENISGAGYCIKKRQGDASK